MARAEGKNIQFWFDGKEVPIENAGYDVQVNEIDVTDSSSASDSTEFVPGRAKRTIKIDCKLDQGDGTEKTTGTLTAGAKYRVTGGTITEGAKSYPVGKIFTSDGTGTASATNKVVPLGQKVVGTGMSLSVGGTTYPVTSVNYDAQYNEIDVTDSSTAATESEFLPGRAKRTLKVDLIMRSETADILAASAPASQAAVLTLVTGVSLSGNVVCLGKSVVDQVNDVVKVSYSFNVVGAPTEVKLGLPMAVSKAFKIIYTTGATTNKEVTGNAMIMQRSITCDINSDAKASYSLSVVGAVTEAVAN